MSASPPWQVCRLVLVGNALRPDAATEAASNTQSPLWNLEVIANAPRSCLGRIQARRDIAPNMSSRRAQSVVSVQTGTKVMETQILKTHD